MNAARKYHESWEALNEKRVHLFLENLLIITQRLAIKTLAILHVVAFVIYKIIKIAGMILKAAFSENTIVRLERDEAWIYRTLK